MRRVKIAGSGSLPAPGFEELSIPRKFRDAVIACGAPGVSLGHEDIAVGADHNIGGLIEQAGIRACDARLTQRHQDLSVRVEFENLIALAILDLRIRHPEVSLS